MENLENNVVNEEVQETVVEEKTFTQSELDEIIKTRLAKEAKKIEKANEATYQAQLKAELEESEKLMKMNEADREKAKAEKERKQFEADRAKYQEERRQFEQTRIKSQTMEMLSERNIPVELAQFINSNNADEIMENVTLFQEQFNKSVEKVVTERLRGNVPQSSTSSNSFTVDQLKNMSAEEINKNWNNIKNNLNMKG